MARYSHNERRPETGQHGLIQNKLIRHELIQHKLIRNELIRQTQFGWNRGAYRFIP